MLIVVIVADLLSLRYSERLYINEHFPFFGGDSRLFLLVFALLAFRVLSQQSSDEIGIQYEVQELNPKMISSSAMSADRERRRSSGSRILPFRRESHSRQVEAIEKDGNDGDVEAPSDASVLKPLRRRMSSKFRTREVGYTVTVCH